MIFKTESGRVSNEIPGIGSSSGTRWALQQEALDVGVVVVVAGGGGVSFRRRRKTKKEMEKEN